MKSIAGSLLVIPVLLVSACGSPATHPQSAPPTASQGMLACTASEYAAGGDCFADHHAACASLSCKSGCDLHGASPKKIHCSTNEASSSRLTRCGGIANWSCPNGMVCVDDPASSCRRDAGFDCVGRCVPPS